VITPRFPASNIFSIAKQAGARIPVLANASGAQSLANTRGAMSEFSFASQYQQNPISQERVNAIDAERERRFSDAYQSNDN
jgi:hypothetical protein